MISGCNNIRGNERMRAWNTVVAAKNRDTAGTRQRGSKKRGEREREMEILETGNTGKTGGGRTVEETRVESVHGLPGAHHFHT